MMELELGHAWTCPTLKCGSTSAMAVDVFREALYTSRAGGNFPIIYSQGSRVATELPKGQLCLRVSINRSKVYSKPTISFLIFKLTTNIQWP